MAWRDAVDGYCERLTPGYWAEPVNAVTNMAFVVAAALVWRRTAGLPLARAMAVVLAAIGVCSGVSGVSVMMGSVLANSCRAHSQP
jgi:hypothetical protein